MRTGHATDTTSSVCVVLVYPTKHNDCKCVCNLNKQGECAIATQTKRRVQSASKATKSTHVNEWKDRHERKVLDGERFICSAYFDASKECLAHYKGNASAYSQAIHKDSRLTRATVRAYLSVMIPLARTYARYEMVEDIIFGMGFEAITWSEIRALSKERGVKKKVQPQRKRPRASFTKEQQTLRKSKAYLALPKAVRDAIDQAMVKENKRK